MTVTPTTDTEAGPSTATASPPESRESSVGVLRLRGGPVRRQRVEWAAETIDNEGMGKKKSKSELPQRVTCHCDHCTDQTSSCSSASHADQTPVCCIYHKPRRFDESSSESESSDGDDDDDCCSHDKNNDGAALRSRDGSGVGGQVEEDSSSESDGGGGDGRARCVMTTPPTLRKQTN